MVFFCNLKFQGKFDKGKTWEKRNIFLKMTDFCPSGVHPLCMANHSDHYKHCYISLFSLPFSLSCVYFSPRRTLHRDLNFCLQTYDISGKNKNTNIQISFCGGTIWGHQKCIGEINCGSNFLGGQQF